MTTTLERTVAGPLGSAVLPDGVAATATDSGVPQCGPVAGQAVFPGVAAGTAYTAPAADPSLVHREIADGHFDATRVDVDRTDGYPLSADFAHGGWSRRRAAVAEALERTKQSTSRQRRFASCGSGWWVLRSRTEPNTYKLSVDRCHDRLCVPCQRARAARINANLADRLTNTTYRLITITLRHTDEPLTAVLNRLYDAFKRLRNTTEWQAHVTGGVAFLEVTRNVKEGHWHAHFHVICEGKYYAQSRLAATWERITGDSRIVDIRLIRSTAGATHYVTKYCTKDTDVDALHHPEAFDEYLTSTAHRRLIVPFGTWAKWKLLAKPTDEGWIRYCHSNELDTNPHLDPEVVVSIKAAIAYALDHPGQLVISCPPARPPPTPTAPTQPIARQCLPF